MRCRRYVLLLLFITLGGFLATRPALARNADLTSLVAANHPAVVNISSVFISKSRSLPSELKEDTPLYEFFRRYFEEKGELPEEFSELPDMPDEEGKREGGGSGFIISADGYILTNTHVVEDADEITVALSDRREFVAEVVGTDKRSDVALLKIAAADLPAVKLGDSDSLKVGQWVFAIGSPFGFELSATQGIVSALGRSLPDETYVPFIQTDVAVNPGNSGGPLFNLDGEVVGINAQIYSRSGGYMGLSFAIPINVAVHVMAQLKDSGKVSRGWLGVLIQGVSNDLAQSFGLDKPAGALVAQVLEDSPAQQAGVQVGDIIIRYSGKNINVHNDLPALVGMSAVNESVDIVVLRKGKEISLTVTIAELSEEDEAKRSAKASPADNRLELDVADLSEEDRKLLKIERGVIVKEVRAGPARRAGVRRGDVILQINHHDIENLDEFEKWVADLPAGKPVSMLIQRDKGQFFISLELPQDDSE
jgi:serine protease Do